MSPRPGDRHLVLAFLAALVMLGGCSGPYDAEPTADVTLTPVVVPDDTATATPGTAGELAPGLTDAGVVDPARLGAAHARTLDAASYTFHRNVTRRALDGTLVLGTDTVLRRTASGNRFRYTLTFSGRERRVVDRYADGTRLYERESTPNATTYRQLRVGEDPRNASFGSLTGRRDVVNLFTRFRFEIEDRVERNGTTHYRLATTEPRDLLPLRDITVRALVSERGLVSEYDISYRVVRDDRAVRVRVTVRIGDVGTTTVAEPAWYDDALAATTATTPTNETGATSGSDLARHPSSSSRSRSSVR